MIIYQVYSNKAGCDIQLKYGENDRLLGVEFLVDSMAILDEEAKTIFYNAPSTVGLLKQLAIKNKWELTEIKPDLSFNVFWKRYDNTNGSKIKAMRIWEKFGDKDKNQALNYISKYKQTLGTTTQAYATTYLNQQYWIK